MTRYALALAATLYAIGACSQARADIGATLGQCLTMLAIDYAQTRDIRNHPTRSESNQIMGKAPGTGTVRGYFAGLALAYTAVDAMAPKGVAKAASIFCVSSHGSAISNNIGLGIGMSF